MGRATISGGGDDGLYTAAMQYETRWVDTMREANEREIEKLEDQILEVDVHITETDQKIDAKKIALGQLLEIYQAVVAALNWQPPTHPDADDDGENLSDFNYGGGGGPNPWVKIISEQWAPETQYKKGDRVVPTWGGGNHHLCLEDGTSGATEPSWARGRDSFTVDGSVVWACVWGLWVTQEVDVPDGPTTTATGMSGWEITTDSASRGEDQVQTVLAPHSPPDMDPVLKAFSYLMRAMVEVKAWRDRKESYERYKAMLQYQIEALEKKNAEMDGATAEPAPQSMWCADLTEDLAGEVDTIEVKGAPDQILIGPAGSVGFAGSKLANVLAMSSAQAGLAWALLPGWQKWRPTYRVGTIHSIDYDADTASVNLDAATSIAQELAINQDGPLSAIPVVYMECNARAFENGDRVVVEFPGQLWEQGPRVIGFETNPQPCGGHAAIFGGVSGVTAPGEDGVNIFAWNQGGAAGGSQTYLTPVPATTGEFNGAWKKGHTVQMGARWRYPFQFVNQRYFSMQLSVAIRIYDAAGNVIQSVALGFGSGAKDKGIGCKTGRFIASFNESWNDVGHYYAPALDSCRATWVAMGMPAGWYVRDGEANQRIFQVAGLNNQNSYNLDAQYTKWSWIDPDYAACSGNTHTIEYQIIPCGVYRYNEPDPAPEETVYRNVGDPCAMVDDPENLFLDQSWSLTGVIDDSGVTLEDSMEPVIVDGQAGPFGPFSLLNANAGPHRVEISPVAGVHHVGFSVSGIVTGGDQLAAIAGGEQPNWFTRMASSALNTSSGFVDFYGLVDRRGQ